MMYMFVNNIRNSHSIGVKEAEYLQVPVRWVAKGIEGRLAEPLEG